MDGNKIIPWVKLFLYDERLELPEDIGSEENLKKALAFGIGFYNARADEKGEPLPFPIKGEALRMYSFFAESIERSKRESKKQSENGKKGGAPKGNQNAAKVIDIKRQIEEMREDSGGSFAKGL